MAMSQNSHPGSRPQYTLGITAVRLDEAAPVCYLWTYIRQGQRQQGVAVRHQPKTLKLSETWQPDISIIILPKA